MTNKTMGSHDETNVPAIAEQCGIRVVAGALDGSVSALLLFAQTLMELQTQEGTET